MAAGAGGGLFPLELHDDNPPSDPLFESDEEPDEVSENQNSTAAV